MTRCHQRRNKTTFFELGGHFLMAVRLFSLIEERFWLRLLLATLFQSEQSLEELATAPPDEASAEASWSCLVPLDSSSADTS